MLTGFLETFGQLSRKECILFWTPKIQPSVTVLHTIPVSDQPNLLERSFGHPDSLTDSSHNYSRAHRVDTNSVVNEINGCASGELIKSGFGHCVVHSASHLKVKLLANGQKHPETDKYRVKS
ncbi:Protein CBG27342 [Caenorhabditis briggsae]|uniref:Protein CBG27342 n=1 Tax=Caenorhabditis briggsae TaxID=6238 RepID=B6IGE3_CAEBR|nr:Protein CBG27342 [Caenorhabditis briggsae]CAR98973.1 Protein CBG27342 [Caenorhabditis briggsae]